METIFVSEYKIKISFFSKIFISTIIDKYSKLDGLSCLKADKRYENLNEAKLDCSSDSKCTRIMDVDCKGEEFYFCRKEIYSHRLESSCVHSKTTIVSKYETVNIRTGHESVINI